MKESDKKELLRLNDILQPSNILGLRKRRCTHRFLSGTCKRCGKTIAEIKRVCEN